VFLGRRVSKVTKEEDSYFFLLLDYSFLLTI